MAKELSPINQRRLETFKSNRRGYWSLWIFLALFLLSLIKQGITGKDADAALGRANITVNKNAVPNDPNPPFVTSGLRIGTPAVTTRGFGEAECGELANWMCDVIANMDDESVINSVKEKVLAVCAKYPVYS